ncbi:carbohydrate binding family 9 domain-containing protein [Thalassotalea sp. SU-HH00458]|uniref:carbohydrate binding family 9 domain-containing protein n=1 Tax=Thalassotalea sp. SU-HH00458 TaxID=3127657 RepID=UPI003104E208
MIFRYLTILLYLFLLFFNAHLFAKTLTKLTRNTQPLSIPNYQKSIQLDGKLDEAIWQKAQHIPLNYIIEPFENTKAIVQTDVYIYESGENLYVGFKAQDPHPEQIRANLRDRDKVWNDDLVGFKLDTLNTHKLAYHFFVNAKGVQIDSIESGITQSFNDNWDAVWQAKTAVSTQGFTAEFIIPLCQLNFADDTGVKHWSAEFIRFYPREVSYKISNASQDRENNCSLCQMQPISGFKAAKQSSNMIFVPSIVVGKNKQRNLTTQENWHSENNVAVGGDFSWNISSDSLFSATINPDFSQIELDNAPLNINNNFSLYLPEKRRFFLENHNYFDSLYNLVYTRNIISPDLGVKYTQRSGNSTFAALASDDENTRLLIPGNLNSTLAIIDEKTINTALRYRYDFSNDSSLGVTNTVRDSENYHNYVFSVDGRIRFSESTFLDAQLLSSRTQYPDELANRVCITCVNESSLRVKSNEELSDVAWQLEFKHTKRNWWLTAYHKHKGEDFRADLGFVSKIDNKESQIRSGYVHYPESTTWNKIEFWLGVDKETNIDNALISDNAEIQLNFNGVMQSRISTGMGKQTKVGLRFDPSITNIADNSSQFDIDFSFIYGEIRPMANFYISGLLLKSDAVDYANNRKGNKIQLLPIVQWDVNNAMNIRLEHTFEKMKVFNEALYTANLTDLRVNYQFNSDSKVRLSLIHNNVVFNPSNYTFDIDKKSKSLGSQLVYSYRFDALSAFYLGLSNNAIANDANGLTTNQKSVFLKLSHTL